MKMLQVMFALVVTTASLCSLCYAQPQEEENVAYEKLKVLEPIIGTWTITRTNDETGTLHETSTTFAWADSKKMITTVSKRRQVKIGGDIATQEWTDGGPRFFYLWNLKSECIEQYFLIQGAGAGFVHGLLPKGDGVFEWKLIHAASPWESGESTVVTTITDTELRLTATNRKGPQGEDLEDVDLMKYRRDKPTGEK